MYTLYACIHSRITLQTNAPIDNKIAHHAKFLAHICTLSLSGWYFSVIHGGEHLTTWHWMQKQEVNSNTCWMYWMGHAVVGAWPFLWRKPKYLQLETTQKQQTRHLSLSRTAHWEMWQVSLIRSGRANWESWEEVATRIEKAGTVYQIWRCRSERKRTPGGTELKWVDLLNRHLAEIPNLQTYMTEIHGDHTSTKPRVSTCHQILPNVLNEQGVKRMRRCVCVCVCACVRAVHSPGQLRKERRYLDLLEQARSVGTQATLSTVQVGCRGFIDNKSFHHLFHSTYIHLLICNSSGWMVFSLQIQNVCIARRQWRHAWFNSGSHTSTHMTD